MKLSEALTFVRKARASGPDRHFDLACGFEPLHLATFLEAELLTRATWGRPRVRVGRFGDLAGNIERATESRGEALVVAMTWSDLDPRLGLRWEADWREVALRDVQTSVEARLAGLKEIIALAATRNLVVLVVPDGELPPLFHESPDRIGETETVLRGAVAQFAGACRNAGARLVRPLQAAADFDPRLEIAAGFPFSLDGAARLAARIADVALGTPPLKGLITDLDNTMWLGTAGEDGEDAVRWQGAEARPFGLYQQVLRGLSDAGVLIGVATRNDPAVVAKVLARPDILVRSSDLFPIEAGWGSKSEAVSRILSAWNLGPESVAFVDDDARELAEVGQTWPAMRRWQSPGTDTDGMLGLLWELRRSFARDSIREEDRLRAGSLGAGTSRTSASDSDEFHRYEQGRLSVETVRADGDGRALELINKTNQFNLNGRRIPKSDWLRLLEPDSGSQILCFQYANRFGNLGRIATVVWRREGDRAVVSSFVLSCRAFARRIEYAVVRVLFDASGCDELAFCFEATPRNGPLREFLEVFSCPTSEGHVPTLSRETYTRATPLVAIEISRDSA